ncbi:MAG: amino acid ABC transporter substrate-binding protein [Betaproteobacteria bacterium AqS2]|uniref:Amino acid ABC transporter substrate-binding protein n=1 Tax=Candidatus Amphirhobacter heronislandensis TaxID=1732024 RepID=A0A930Y2R5_9GAMM|nr:amino acid ABC transporter substrate-binding protein [Betaproteobacteria bacterium AqS2]
MKQKSIIISVLAAGMAAAGAASAQTIDSVKGRNELVCGVSGGLAGFSAPDDSGRMQGLDADYCYGLAAAILGPNGNVRFVNLTAKERFEALASGEVDVLSRNTTHTLTRDASLGLNFTYYNFIDGQAFMVYKSLGVSSALDLDGARVCVQSGTTTEANMADFFRTNNMSYEQIAYDTSPDTTQGFENNYCDVLSSDTSQLASIRSELSNPSDAVILPEVISKEPLGPVVRQGDDEFFNLAKWVLYAVLNAEELGITQANVDQHRGNADADPAIKRLVGTEGGMCKLISSKLDDACLYNVVKTIGNYGESYERHVGANTPLGINREGTPNALWSKGGLLYAPPLR